MKARGKYGWISQALFALSLVFLSFGLINLGWVVWPQATNAVRLTIPAGDLPGSPSGKPYASLSEYTLTVSWPVWIRFGQVGSIEVTLKEEDIQLEDDGKDRVQVVVLEPALANISLDPPGRTQGSLAGGQVLNFSWDLIPVNTGTYSGKVYVSFGFFDDTQEALVTVPVAVVDVEVQVRALWGLTANLNLWLGVVGMVIWGALFVLGRAIQGKQRIG